MSRVPSLEAMQEGALLRHKIFQPLSHPHSFANLNQRVEEEQEAEQANESCINSKQQDQLILGVDRGAGIGPPIPPNQPLDSPKNNFANNLEVINYQLQKFRERQIKSLGLPWYKSGGVMIAFYVFTFLARLKAHLSSQRVLKLNNDVFELLGDHASDYVLHTSQCKHKQKQKLSGGILKQRGSIIKTFFGKLCCLTTSTTQDELNPTQIYLSPPASQFVLYSFSTMLVIWNFILAIALLANQFFIPFKIAFMDMQTQNFPSFRADVLFVLSDVPGLLYIAATALEFFTAYYEDGRLVEDNAKIVNNKLVNKSFIIDIVVILFSLISKFEKTSWVADLMLLARMFKLKRVVSELEEYANLRERLVVIYEIAKQLIFVAFVVHAISIIFFIFNLLEIFENRHTMSNNGWNHYPHDDILEHYADSLYWIMSAMAGLGYDNTMPQTIVQKIFAIAASVLGGFLFINTACIFLQLMIVQSSELLTISPIASKTALIVEQLRRRGSTRKLQMRVRNYLLWENECIHGQTMAMNEILKQLPAELHQEVSLEVYEKAIQKVDLFQQSFSPQFLRELALGANEVHIPPNQQITKQGGLWQDVFIVLHGNVDIIAQVGQQTKTLARLGSGNCFDLHAFFSGCSQVETRTGNAGALLLRIEWQTFVKAFRNLPLDYEVYCDTRERLTVYQNSCGTGLRCQVCQQFLHDMGACPFVYYQPNKHRILNTHHAGLSAAVADRKRLRPRTQSSRIYLEYLQLEVVRLMQDNGMAENLRSFRDRLKMQKQEVRRWKQRGTAVIEGVNNSAGIGTATNGSAEQHQKQQQPKQMCQDKIEEDQSSAQVKQHRTHSILFGGSAERIQEQQEQMKRHSSQKHIVNNNDQLRKQHSKSMDMSPVTDLERLSDLKKAFSKVSDDSFFVNNNNSREEQKNSLRGLDNFIEPHLHQQLSRSLQQIPPPPPQSQEFQQQQRLSQKDIEYLSPQNRNGNQDGGGGSGGGGNKKLQLQQLVNNSSQELNKKIPSIDNLVYDLQVNSNNNSSAKNGISYYHQTPSLLDVHSRGSAGNLCNDRKQSQVTHNGGGVGGGEQTAKQYQMQTVAQANRNSQMLFLYLDHLVSIDIDRISEFQFFFPNNNFSAITSSHQFRKKQMTLQLSVYLRNYKFDRNIQVRQKINTLLSYAVQTRK